MQISVFTSRRAALFTVAILTSAVSASASPFSVGRAGVAAACLGTFLGPQIGDCSIGGKTVGVGSGLAQVNSTFSGSGDTLTAFSMGDASFGVLRASASGSYNITGPATNALAFGQAVFTDLITISFAPWNGTPGLLYVNYTLDGTISSAGTGNGGAAVQLFAGTDDSTPQSRLQLYNSSTTGVFSVGAPIQFVYGQPFGFNFSLSTCVNGAILGCSSLVSGTGSGTSDFSNTLVVSGLTPTDLAGNQALGATFSSGSGTQYSVNGVAAVPEPESVLLMITGVIGIVIRRRLRK